MQEKFAPGHGTCAGCGIPTIVRTVLGATEDPESKIEECSNEDIENFKKTVELETHASDVYREFSSQAEEGKIKFFFNALARVEQEHIELMGNYMQLVLA